MLSVAYFGFFLDKIPAHLYENMARAMGENIDILPQEKRQAAFIAALKKLISACGLDDLKMSDYGVQRAEIPELVKNARETMGGLFTVDRHTLSFGETIQIFEEAFS